MKEWKLLLKRYIESESILKEIDNYREEQREVIMSSHYSSYDDELEHYTSVSAETTALRLVALDEFVTKEKKRCIKRITVLKQALDTLTIDEQAAFQRVAFGTFSFVPESYDTIAINKVYDFINEYEELKEAKTKKRAI